MQIIEMNVDEIKPYEKNAKKHTAKKNLRKENNMIVVIQSKNGVIDTNKITKVTTNKEGGIYATCENNTRETLAAYDNLNVAKFALGMYASALAEDERIFYFPNNEEVKSKMTLKRNNVSKTAANSHGGS